MTTCQDKSFKNDCASGGILLVKPYWPFPYSKNEHTYNRIWPPLDLMNCAALLEKSGFKVKILDCHALRIKPEKINRYAKGFDKVFITSSTLDRWQCPNVDINPFLETVKHLVDINANTYLMGYHCTVGPENILRKSKALVAIRGEPETAVVDLCKNVKLSDIKGISFISQGTVVDTQASDLFDLANMPLPAFHLCDFTKYSYEILGKGFALFEIGRGCRYNCIFCNKTMYGSGLRSKSKEQIFRELDFAIEQQGVKTGYFIDLDFFANKELVQQICEYIISKKYKFKWACQGRSDDIDVAIVKKIKMAGCTIIHMGIESGRQENLDYFKKGVDFNSIARAVKICKDAGLKILGFFIFGLPNEDYSDMLNTFNFACKLNIDFVSFHKLHFYGQRRQPSGEIDKFIKKAFLKYYLRFKYVKNISLVVLIRCFKLFFSRIATLKGD